MNPTSEQKRIAFGYNCHETALLSTRDKPLVLSLYSTIIYKATVCLKSRLSLKD